MQIYGPFRLSTTQAAQSTSRPQPNRLAGDPSVAKPSTGPVDQLDLSSSTRETSGTQPTASVNRLEGTSSVAGSGEIRIDRVAQLRREIAEGSYETPEKLDAALDRLLDDLV